MSRDEVRKWIVELLKKLDCFETMPNTREDVAEQILSHPFIAVVDREADRRICNPDLHYDSAVRYKFKHEFYIKIPEGWVKEVE